jgi:hypothetical protein
MDLTRAQLGTILRKYARARHPDIPCSARTVQSYLSSLEGAYARIYGITYKQKLPGDTFGDLTYLTLQNLQQVCKSPSVKPCYVDKAHPTASPKKQEPLSDASLRKFLENTRSCILAVSAHVSNSSLESKQSLIESYTAARNGLSAECERLRTSLKRQTLTKERSDKQQSKWVPWPDLKLRSLSVYKYIEDAISGKNEDINHRFISEVKKLQGALLYAMYTLFPPLRNDFVTLRFVQQDGQLRDGDLVEYLEQLAAECETREKLSSVNYVLVPDKGPVELVLRAWRTIGENLGIAR